MKYPVIKFGEHFGKPLNEIPWDYLVWLFPILRQEPDGRDSTVSYKHAHKTLLDIIDFFLDQDIRIEDRTAKGQGWCFYRNDILKRLPSGDEMPFIQSFWRMKNSKGEFIYEIESHGRSIFLLEDGVRYTRATQYVSHKYIYGGMSMVYEKNPEYYFYDGFGKIMLEAYLMRQPWIPDGSISANFSDNLLMKNKEI